MDLKHYQRQALRTAQGDAESKMRLAIAALGLVGEGGEFAEIVKKHVGHGHPLEVSRCMAELGDVLWYVAECASALGLSLDDIAAANVAKLQKRYPDKFTTEASVARVDV